MLLASVLTAAQSRPGVAEIVLETGKAIDRNLAGAETHSFRIETAEANLYCSFIVDKRGIDIFLAIFNADGKKLAEVDNFNGASGPERLNIVLDRPALYRVEVRSFGENASGQYGIRLAALCPVTNADITRVAAERASSSLQTQRTATAKYQEALKGFAEIKDLQAEADSFTGLGKILFYLGDNPPALEAFRQGLDRSRSLGDRKGEAFLLQRMGASYFRLSELSKALDYNNQALIMYQGMGNRDGEGMEALLRQDGINKPAPPKTITLLADPVFSGDDSRVPRAQGTTQTSASLVPLQLQRALSDTGIAGSRISRLPGTRREAAAIRALLPAAGYRESLDFEARRETRTGAVVAEAGIVYLATHGLLNTVHPELSGLVLSLVDRQGKPKDGFLRLHEIYNLELQAGLVVLSACQTGLGKEVRGEGLIGLTRGFICAGAPRVMASLRKVDDRATAELMAYFYKAIMSDGGQTPAAALRAAQVAMWKSKSRTDPYYWAAFSLQGEWI